MSQMGLPLPREYSGSWTPSPLPDLTDVHELAVDCETDGLRWWDKNRVIGIAVAYKRDGRTHSQYIPVRHSGGNVPEERALEWARSQLRGKRIVNLRTSFDIHMLRGWGADLEALGCTVGDVGHYAALLDDHRRRFNLEEIAQSYVGHGKVTGLDMSSMAEYHAGDVAEYAETDVRLVIEILDRMNPLLESEGLRQVCDLEDRLIFPVCEMERLGSPLDEELLRKWVIESEQEYLRLRWELNDMVGFQTDPNSREHLVFLLEKYGIPVVKYTDGGSPSTDDSVLRSIEHPVFQKVRKIRKLASLRSKYLLPYLEEIEREGVLRYALHQLRADDGGTVSGRFSSSAFRVYDGARWYNVGANIQQVMSVKRQTAEEDRFVVRELFVPESGLWYSADAMQIEYRLFAHYSRSDKIIDAYRRDPMTDFHETVRKMISAVSPGITRKRTKDVNFAKIYGAGLSKISAMLGLSIDDARQFVDVYDRTFPEASALLNKAMKTAESRGYVKTLLGRRTRFTDRRRLHKALNGVIQGSAADIMKIKLIELHESRRETGFKMRFTVHDEVDGDVPDQEAADKVTEILNRQSVPLRVPILWDAGTGRNWRECE